MPRAEILGPTTWRRGLVVLPSRPLSLPGALYVTRPHVRPKWRLRTDASYFIVTDELW